MPGFTALEDLSKSPGAGPWEATLSRPENRSGMMPVEKVVNFPFIVIAFDYCRQPGS